MAIQCVSGDIHLTSGNSPGFTDAADPFSITVWVNSPNWSTGTTQSFVGLYGPFPTPSTAIQIGTRGAGLVGCWTWGGGLLISSSSAVQNSQWHHIAYTFDGASHRLYVNGILSNTTNNAQNPGQLTTIFINGYPTGVAAETAAYQVDSYAYFNRTLSGDEVLTMFNSCGARHGIISGVLAKYEFDEASQDSVCSGVVDLSGLNNQLSIAGTGSLTYSYTGTVASSNLRRMH